MPVIPNKPPIPAVIITPKAPPAKILRTVLGIGDDAILALITPVAKRPKAVNTKIAVT